MSIPRRNYCIIIPEQHQFCQNIIIIYLWRRVACYRVVLLYIYTLLGWVKKTKVRSYELIPCQGMPDHWLISNISRKIFKNQYTQRKLTFSIFYNMPLPSTQLSLVLHKQHREYDCSLCCRINILFPTTRGHISYPHSLIHSYRSSQSL